MTFSYIRIILDDCELGEYFAGKELYQARVAAITLLGNARCKAEVLDGTMYSVTLGFAKVGTPQYTCNCLCSHIVAAALAWDHERSVEPLSDAIAAKMCSV